MTVQDFEPLTLTIPLREDPPGVFRVGKSRVLLELVLRAYLNGESPESIVQSYDTLNLSDVYAIVSRYIASPQIFDDYLQQRDVAAEEVRQKFEAKFGSRQITIEELKSRMK